jgi:hypothetical protein
VYTTELQTECTNHTSAFAFVDFIPIFPPIRTIQRLEVEEYTLIKVFNKDMAIIRLLYPCSEISIITRIHFSIN